MSRSAYPCRIAREQSRLLQSISSCQHLSWHQQKQTPIKTQKMKIRVNIEHRNKRAILHKTMPATEMKPDFQLMQNTPNPFRGATTIRFSVPRSCRVKLSILDKERKIIRTLFNEEAAPGWHQVTWFGDSEDGLPVPTGDYQYLLESDGFVATRKLEINCKSQKTNDK